MKDKYRNRMILCSTSVSCGGIRSLEGGDKGGHHGEVGAFPDVESFAASLAGSAGRVNVSFVEGSSVSLSSRVPTPSFTAAPSPVSRAASGEKREASGEVHKTGPPNDGKSTISGAVFNLANAVSGLQRVCARESAGCAVGRARVASVFAAARRPCANVHPLLTRLPWLPLSLSPPPLPPSLCCRSLAQGWEACPMP